MVQDAHVVHASVFMMYLAESEIAAVSQCVGGFICSVLVAPVTLLAPDFLLDMEFMPG